MAPCAQSSSPPYAAASALNTLLPSPILYGVWHNSRGSASFKRGHGTARPLGGCSGRRVHVQALVSLKIKETVDAGVGRTKAVIIEGG